MEQRTPSPLDALVELLADRIAARVVDRLRGGEQPGWIDQAQSSLGRRRHIAAVRRRVARGDAGAVQVGRRFLLSKPAHDEELRALGHDGGTATQSEEQIARELGLVIGGRR